MILLYVRNLNAKIHIRQGDTMTKETIIEIGWNLDSSYARLPKSFFTSLNPIAERSPKLIIFNDSLATSLGLNAQWK